MPATNFATPPAVTPEADLRIDCYVRSTIPGPIAETIDTVVDRLDRLCEADRITDYEITLWPPARDAISAAIDRGERTRTELLAAFERWADRNEYSLEPAFRREEVPLSPFGLGSSDPRQRVRVPLVALAIHEVDEAEAGMQTESETLRGVVPCTDNTRTYTVTDWLSTIERTTPGQTVHTDGAVPIDGQQ